MFHFEFMYPANTYNQQWITIYVVSIVLARILQYFPFESCIQMYGEKTLPLKFIWCMLLHTLFTVAHAFVVVSIVHLLCSMFAFKCIVVWLFLCVFKAVKCPSFLSMHFEAHTAFLSSGLMMSIDTCFWSTKTSNSIEIVFS